MSEWKARRFWKTASLTETGAGFGVALDARPLRTPAGARLIVPTRAMAAAIAAEWQAQDSEVKPASMPVTRAANAAIDKVSAQFDEVAGMIAAYADSDLLCYRAGSPQELVARQAAAWDPLLDWAAQRFGARLMTVSGVMHRPQDARALGRLADQVHAMGPFELTAFHDLVGLSGSLVLGLAAIHEVAPIGEIWRLSRIDETWQEEQWGIDEEARTLAGRKESEFRAAKRFHDLARDRGQVAPDDEE